jgi:hypothetical protein
MRINIKGTSVKSRFPLSALLLALSVCLLPNAPAKASEVLYDATGFMQGAQSFTDSFDLTAPGTLTITLTEVPWLDTIQNLNCFVSTTSGIIGSGTNGDTETVQVGPGMVYAHWYGDAVGNYPFGVLGVSIAFTPVNTVPLPATLGLLLSGLGVLSLWLATRRSQGLVVDVCNTV